MFQVVEYTTIFFTFVHFHISSYKPLSKLKSGGILEKCLYYATE